MSLALIYRKCIDCESCSIQVASVDRSVEREEKVSIKLRRNAWNIRFYLFYLAVFIHLWDVNAQLSVPYIEFPLYTRYRHDRRRRRRWPFNSPTMSTNPYGDRTSETQNGSSRLSSLSTKDTLPSISSLFEAIKRLNVSRCDNRIVIAPLTRSRSKASTDRSAVTRIGKSSRIRRVGHPIDMETDIGVASWSLLDGRSPYSENSRIGKGPYRRIFIDISKTDKSRKLEFCIANSGRVQWYFATTNER